MPNTNETWEHCGKPLHEFRLTRLPRGNKDSHQEFKVDVQAHQRGKTGPKNTDAEKIKQDFLQKEEKISLTSMIEN